MKELNEKLVKVQKSLKAPKNQYNGFGKYSYRSAEDILEAVKPLLNDCTILLSDDIQIIGNRFYVKATATFTDGTDSISVIAFAREDEVKKGMDASQITGSCSSYARKYALNGLLLIDDNKDADATNNGVSGCSKISKNSAKPTSSNVANNQLVYPADYQNIDDADRAEFLGYLNGIGVKYEPSKEQKEVSDIKFHYIAKLYSLGVNFSAMLQNFKITSNSINDVSIPVLERAYQKKTQQQGA